METRSMKKAQAENANSDSEEERGEQEETIIEETDQRIIIQENTILKEANNVEQEENQREENEENVQVQTSTGKEEEEMNMMEMIRILMRNSQQNSQVMQEVKQDIKQVQQGLDHNSQEIQASKQELKKEMKQNMLSMQVEMKQEMQVMKATLERNIQYNKEELRQEMISTNNKIEEKFIIQEEATKKLDKKVVDIRKDIQGNKEKIREVRSKIDKVVKDVEEVKTTTENLELGIKEVEETNKKRIEENQDAIRRLKEEELLRYAEIEKEIRTEVDRMSREVNWRNVYPTGPCTTNDILKFNGDINKLHPKVFIKSITNKFQYSDGQIDRYIQDWKEQTRRHFEGKALVWYSTKEETFESFEEFVKGYMEYYWGEYQQNRVREELYFNKYDPNKMADMTEYAMLLYTKSQYLDPKMKEEEIVMCIARQYGDGIGESVAISNIKSLDQLSTYLRKIQIMRRGRSNNYNRVGDGNERRNRTSNLETGGMRQRETRTWERRDNNNREFMNRNYMPDRSNREWGNQVNRNWDNRNNNYQQNRNNNQEQRRENFNKYGENRNWEDNKKGYWNQQPMREDRRPRGRSNTRQCNNIQSYENIKRSNSMEERAGNRTNGPNKSVECQRDWHKIETEVMCHGGELGAQSKGAIPKNFL